MASNVIRLFESPAHASLYAKYRFSTPPKIGKQILEYVKSEIKSPLKLALDVGCGTGQSTKWLAPHFDRIIATDVSQSQIQEAINLKTDNNIDFQVGSASQLPAEDHTVSLITGSQCHHWLDLPTFYKEAKRVLIPKGVLCLYWYLMPQPIYEDKSKALQDLVSHLYTVETKEYWNARRAIVDKGFDGLEFPFESVVKDTPVHEIDVTVKDIFGYVKSWSAYQEMKKAQPSKADKMMSRFQEQVKEVVGYDPDVDNKPLKLRFTYYVIMGR